ncbi:MAG: hypothetical protein K8S18_13860 [Desulfobacula sp.]|nr:hypothetical protein [Desulfobacula sp.]
MHIGKLKDKDNILNLDPLGNNFETFYHTPLPTGLKEDAILTFMTNFTIPDPMKDKPLLLFIPTTAYPIEIKVNKYLVFAGGIMTSKTNLGKYFGGREFISPKILNFTGTTLLTIQIVPRRIRIELPKIFFGGYQDISSKTVWYSIVHYCLFFGFSLLSFFFFIMFVLLWMVSKFKNYSQLYFAITCFFFGGGYLFMIFSNASMEGLLLYKLSRFCYTASSISIFFFILDFIGLKKITKKLSFNIIGLCIIFVFIFLFFSLDSKYEVKQLFKITSRFLIGPILFISPILLFWESIRKKRIEALIIFIAFTITDIAAVRDLIYDQNFKDAEIWWLPIGYIILAWYWNKKTYSKPLQNKKKKWKVST